MSEQATILRKARALIEDPAMWCQGSHTDEHGRCCASGALLAVGADLLGPSYRTLNVAMGGSSVCSWNDEEGRTHAEVLAAFDKAIASLEASA